MDKLLVIDNGSQQENNGETHVEIIITKEEIIISKDEIIDTLKILEIIKRKLHSFLRT